MSSLAVDSSAVRVGRVRGRYFRENFAQGGIDLVQVIPELVTNADAAIAAAGRGRGRIALEVADPDPAFLAAWTERMGALGSPALLSWRHELRCTDDGEGVDADRVDARLGALGVSPPSAGQRGLFGRGLRDVWLAQGAGRIQGIRAGRFVESWFFPAGGDDPYAFCHVQDRPATDRDRAALGVGESGTRVTVPLQAARLPAAGRLRALVGGLVQLRPVLCDPARTLSLQLPGKPAEPVSHRAPEVDPQRPVLFDADVTVAPDVRARVTVRRAAEPLSQGFSRATRPGGLVVRSGRAAHETTLGFHEGRPGARHLYGEVVCQALEDLQRSALERPRPQLVVRVDRSGLNEHHPIVQRLYRAIDRVLAPIVAAEERRASSDVVAAPRAVSARDRVGLRALNDLLRAAFDRPGTTGAEPGEHPPDARAGEVSEAAGEPASERDVETAPPSPVGESESGEEPEAPAPAPALWFKRSPLRLHPGEQRTVTVLADPARIPPGSVAEAEADPGLTVSLRDHELPAPGARGVCALRAGVRARVTAEPGSRLSVLVACAEHTAELEVLIVRHRASGWVREIARQKTDQAIEAAFDPETGVVTVYEGRREFKDLERAARRAGYTPKRAPEYVPYRMLEVEAAANAVYQWAAEQILARRLPEERPADGSDYATAVRQAAQGLRHRAHPRLMQAFLEPEIYEGQVTLADPARGRTRGQLRLV